MIKIYQNYIIKSFAKIFLYVFFIFLFLTIILNIFEEVSFFKNTDVSLFFPFYMTLLNTPSVIYETFPFIFFIATQFIFNTQAQIILILLNLIIYTVIYFKLFLFRYKKL